MGFIQIRLETVPENSVLAEDIRWKQQKLLKRGHILKRKDIELLMRRNIPFVSIEKTSLLEQDYAQFERQSSFNPASKSLKEEIDLLSSIYANHMQDDFYGEAFLEALKQLNPELRHGAALREGGDIEFVCALFSTYMKNEVYKQALDQMKEKDDYTYLHAIDVFTISLLFLKYLGVESLERIGIGFLLHDIGKLSTPQEILKKRGKLSKPEFDVMKQHAQNGYTLLCQLGASEVAHLALSHHEKADGTGYPNQVKLLELPIEVRVLQLVDMYSAITMRRVYRKERSANEAIKLLFQDKKIVDETLLEQFVSFLGIYPEDAIVQLSNGMHAVVENVNERYPLLPTVRIFETGDSFTLPLDFQLTIAKLISYHVETPQQLFVKFSEYLVNCRFEEMVGYYGEMKQRYRMDEWFTHIYIPIYQIFKVLRMQNAISDSRAAKCEQQLTNLLTRTNLKIRQLNVQKRFVLIIVITKDINLNLVRMLEGLLHTEDIYTVVLRYGEDDEEIKKCLDDQKFEALFVIGKSDIFIQSANEKLRQHYLSMYELEQLLLHIASVRPLEIDVLNELARYEKVNYSVKEQV